jgi:hypothetical protein
VFRLCRARVANGLSEHEQRKGQCGPDHRLLATRTAYGVWHMVGNPVARLATNSVWHLIHGQHQRQRPGTTCYQPSAMRRSNSPITSLISAHTSFLSFGLRKR